MLVANIFCFSCNVTILWTIFQIAKILDLSKLKASADDNLNLTKILKFIFEREENIVGKGDFLLFPQCF